MSYDRGVVVWSVDPFKDDTDAGRPWLVVSNDRQPFIDEQSMTVALSTSGYDPAVRIPADVWTEGGVPQKSYALPWAVHSVSVDDVDEQLGRLTQEFVDDIVAEIELYLERPEP